MSFGGFSFGSGSNSAPSSATQPAVPQFSLTAPTPTVSASSTFSFGNNSASQTQAGQQQGSTGAQAPSTSSTGQTGSLFGFGQNQNQSTSQSANPGQSGTQTQQQQSSGSLFGGSLFGAKPAQSAPAAGTNTGGGLFGGGSSLFGSQTTRPQQNQQSSTSLFGQSSTTQQPATTSLFGQSTVQPSSGLFGSSNQAQKPAGSTLFGSTTQPQQSLLSSQNQQSGLGQSSSASSSGLNKTTRFTDLPEQAQRTIEQLDGFFKQQKEAGKGINPEPLGQAIQQTSLDVKAASEEASALTQGINALQSSLKQLKDKFDSEETDLRKVAEIWETYRSVDGRPGAVRVAAHRDFPHEFFARTAAGMQERAARYRKSIAQLQRVIQSLSSRQDTVSPHAIAQTIQNHQNAILSLAARLEQMQIRMIHLKGVYTDQYREGTNSMRDPFEVAREEKGLPPIRAASWSI
ncbi:hypothetical protein BD324DRAFT_633726 [Kockovaella imperatae]|uniref:Nucleoporin complex subunit 54-domain-containing protein n=1 Tax=Kockovaella imperatae TaxID=4999 RepID=A0A1Y1UAI3_9TREE|nr:hypothetical protein BD324DRAFT_633726 [Kockovaella imperatae]ORX35048.1 hypothetical protein BD324DRAFT_633726 [Kockovaella imperatae]